LTLRFEMRALEVHPRAVAIERFFQRRDDDAREPRFELAQDAGGGRQREVRVGTPLKPPAELRQVRQRVEHPHPLREAHRLSLWIRSEEHTSELQSRFDLVCRLLLEKKKKKTT